LKIANKVKLLVVDDEETIRELFKEYLSADGYLVRVASSGREAIEIIRSGGESFDLFLIDLVMPEMDGLEVIREIRKLDTNTPVLLLTSYEVELGEAKKKELNIVCLISKGISMSEVSKNIKRQR
jgi:CheY-like chemotaxis protein